MNFLGCRLNYKKHKDIVDWLEKFKEKERSEEARRLLSLAISITKGEHQVTHTPISTGPITWDLPTEPTVKEIKGEEDNFVMNILGSFGEKER